MNIWNLVVSNAMKIKLNRTLSFEKALGEYPNPDMKPHGKALLYVHIPYCEEVCPFCCFNSYPIYKYENTIDDYFEALKKEIKIYKDLGYNFSSAYFGGGTPTIVPHKLGEIIEYIKKLFDIEEISVEANPKISKETVNLLSSFGVDRLSVGIQSFNDKLLKEIGRYDKYGSSKEILKRLEYILGKFRIVNLDFIFNLPTQTPKILEKDLKTAIEIGADQITCYPLMIAQQNKKNMGKADYDKEKYMYFNVILPLLEEKYIPASSWCFSRKVEDKNIDMIDEYIVDFQDYIGTGCGSFSFINGYVNNNVYTIPLYIKLLKENKFPTLNRSKKLSEKDHMRYYTMMSLFGRRLNLNHFKNRFKKDFKKAMLPEYLLLKVLGLIEERGNYIYTNKKGMYVFLIMLREFFVYANKLRYIGKKSSIDYENYILEKLKKDNFLRGENAVS